MRITVFFSNYDEDCKVLFNLLKNGNKSLFTIINPICIDYKEIHDIVRTSTNIKISMVPTLLVENNNQIELYEGNESFEYIEQVIKNINSENSKTQKNEITDISDLWINDSEIEENLNKPGQKDKKETVKTAKDIEKERQQDIEISSPKQETQRY